MLQQDLGSLSYDKLTFEKKVALYEIFLTQPPEFKKYLDTITKYIFHKKPPTVDEFLDHREGWLTKATIDGLYPYIIDAFYDIIENSQKYNIIALYGATRTGKSTITRLLILYTQIYIHFLREANLFFKLSPDTNLSQYLICFNYRKTNQLLLSPLWKLIKKSPRFIKTKFKDQVPILQHEKGIDYFVYSTATESGEITNFSDFWILLGNDSPLSFIGNDIIQMFITEITYFIEYEGATEEEIFRLYTDGIDRIEATVGKNVPLSFILFDASANSTESKIEKHILEDLKDRPDVFFFHKSRWEAIPHLFPVWQKTGETFKVITGNSGIPACIVENESQLENVPKNLIMETPIDAYDRFKNNISKSIRDIGGRPISRENRFIQDKTFINNLFNNNTLQNIEGALVTDAISLPENLIWNQIVNKFFVKQNLTDYIIKRASREPRYIGVDLAHALLGDLIGITMLHKEWSEELEQIIYVSDFSFPLKADQTGINLEATSHFIFDLMSLGHVMIKGVFVDGFQSAFLIQACKRYGIEISKKQSVDVELAPYQFYMTCLTNETHKVGKNIFLKNNLDSLIRKKDKKTNKEIVDHSSGDKYYMYDGDFKNSLCGINAKDVSDSDCQALYGAKEDKTLPVTSYESENRRFSKVLLDIRKNIDNAYNRIHTNF